MPAEVTATTGTRPSTQQKSWRSDQTSHKLQSLEPCLHAGRAPGQERAVRVPARSGPACHRTRAHVHVLTERPMSLHHTYSHDVQLVTFRWDQTEDRGAVDGDAAIAAFRRLPFEQQQELARTLPEPTFPTVTFRSDGDGAISLHLVGRARGIRDFHGVWRTEGDGRGIQRRAC